MKKKAFLLLVFLLVTTDLFGRARRFAIGPMIGFDYNYAFVNYDAAGGDFNGKAIYPSVKVGGAVRFGRYNRWGILSRLSYVRSLDASLDTNVYGAQKIPLEGITQEFLSPMYCMFYH